MRTATSLHFRREERGSVLIVVLVVCLALVSITLLFGHSMLLTFRGVDNELAGRQAEQAIEGGLRYAETLLANAETPGQLPDLTTYESEGVPIGEATIWFLGQPVETEQNETPVFGLVDEASRLNLNTASQEMLGALPGMTEELAAAIIDWRDTDEDITANGAESETYQRRQPALTCKNGPFETTEELALLNGATREILYGEDTNMNGILDPNEDDGDKTPPADNSDGKLDPGILSYVTAFSREPIADADGAARINLNVTPLPPELWMKVEEVLGADVRQQVESRVGAGPFRSVLQFYVRSELAAADFDKLAGYLTASTASQPANLINLNTASETVLACVPAIGAPKAASLVAARLSRTQDTNIEWFKEALGAEAGQAAGDLTIWSYQVSADVAAVGRHGRGFRRTRFVIDLSTGTPRVIYRRNLSPLGWALGAEARHTLALQKETR